MHTHSLEGAHVRGLATIAGLVIGSLLASGSAFAQVPDEALEETLEEPAQEYLVELLFFRHRDSATGTQEGWSPRPAEPEPELEPESQVEEEKLEITEEMLAAEELKRSMEESLVRAPRSEFQLLEVSSKLASSSNYAPFAHIGWTQPGYLLDLAPSFPIEAALAGGGTLSGTATLSKGRYLRLDVDIEFRPQGGPPPLGLEENQTAGGLSEPSPQRPMYYIVEQRRSIKSNEIHYFDNPTFGIISQVTPLLTDEEESSIADPATASR